MAAKNRSQCKKVDVKAIMKIIRIKGNYKRIPAHQPLGYQAFFMYVEYETAHTHNELNR